MIAHCRCLFSNVDATSALTSISSRLERNQSPNDIMPSRSKGKERATEQPKTSSSAEVEEIVDVPDWSQNAAWPPVAGTRLSGGDQDQEEPAIVEVLLDPEDEITTAIPVAVESTSAGVEPADLSDIEEEEPVRARHRRTSKHVHLDNVSDKPHKSRSTRPRRHQHRSSQAGDRADRLRRSSGRMPEGAMEQSESRSRSGNTPALVSVRATKGIEDNKGATGNGTVHHKPKRSTRPSSSDAEQSNGKGPSVGDKQRRSRHAGGRQTGHGNRTSRGLDRASDERSDAGCCVIL